MQETGGDDVRKVRERGLLLTAAPCPPVKKAANEFAAFFIPGGNLGRKQGCGRIK
jgi:hypothetical protein